MGEVPLSLHVDAELKQGLEQEARLQNVSESELAGRAIRAFLDGQAHKRDALATAVAEADKGRFISSNAMLDWLERLEEDIDAPPPQPDVFAQQRG